MAIEFLNVSGATLGRANEVSMRLREAHPNQSNSPIRLKFTWGPPVQEKLGDPLRVGVAVDREESLIYVFRQLSGAKVNKQGQTTRKMVDIVTTKKLPQFKKRATEPVHQEPEFSELNGEPCIILDGSSVLLGTVPPVKPTDEV